MAQWCRDVGGYGFSFLRSVMVVHSASSVMELMIEEAYFSTSWRPPGLVWLHISAWVVSDLVIEEIWLSHILVNWPLTWKLSVWKKLNLSHLSSSTLNLSLAELAKEPPQNQKTCHSQASTHLSPPYLLNIFADMTTTNKRVLLDFWTSLTRFNVFK